MNRGGTWTRGRGGIVRLCAYLHCALFLCIANKPAPVMACRSDAERAATMLNAGKWDPSVACGYMSRMELDQLLAWLRSRTDPTTHLVSSYDPTTNRSMDGQAAIYDLALAIILYTDLGMEHEAGAILDVLDGMFVGRGLPNFVDTRLASHGLEVVTHTGPVLWIGLASYRAYRTFGNRQHLELALAIADWATEGRTTCGIDSDARPAAAQDPEKRFPHYAPTQWQAFEIPRACVRMTPAPDEGERAELDEASSHSTGAAGATEDDVTVFDALDCRQSQTVCVPTMSSVPGTNSCGHPVPYERIVSTEHIIDLYGLTAMLREEASLSPRQRANYEFAHSRASRYLQAMVRPDEECDLLGVAGIANNPADRDACILAGGILARGKRGQVLNPDLKIAPADVFWWWAAAIDDDVISTASSGAIPCNDGLVQIANRRFMREASIAPGAGRFGSVNGSDYVPWAEGVPGSCCNGERKAPLVSVEWSGEAILALRLSGDESTARSLDANMDKLSIRGEFTPSEAESEKVTTFAYPYASAASTCVFDSGWLTADPPRDPPVNGAGPPLAGSIAGSAWVAFGALGINPFRLPKTATATPANLSVPTNLPKPVCPKTRLDVGVPKELHLAAAWACLSDDSLGSEERATEALFYACRVLDIEGVKAKACPSPDGGVSRRSGNDQQAATSRARSSAQPHDCSFDAEDNTLATARLVGVLAMQDQGKGCDDEEYYEQVQALLRDHRYACYWDPRNVVGQPWHRHREERDQWHVIGEARPLGKQGGFVRVVDSLATKSGWCAAKVASELGQPIPNRLPGLRWMADGQASLGYANNLFFSTAHEHLALFNSRLDAGLVVRTEHADFPIFVHGRLLWATGAGELSEMVWLRNRALGIGSGVLFKFPERPAWLQELDVRAEGRVSKIYYTVDAADRIHDVEALGTASARALAWFPYGRHAALWIEDGLATHGGKYTAWTTSQQSLWFSNGLRAGARVVDLVDVYGSADVVVNALNTATDWDNNLRVGGGLRVPFLRRLSGPQDTLQALTVRLDAWYKYTAVYWDWVRYVPGFRPRHDVQASIQIWGALSGPTL